MLIAYVQRGVNHRRRQQRTAQRIGDPLPCEGIEEAGRVTDEEEPITAYTACPPRHRAHAADGADALRHRQFLRHRRYARQAIREKRLERVIPSGDDGAISDEGDVRQPVLQRRETCVAVAGDMQLAPAVETGDAAIVGDESRAARPAQWHVERQRARDDAVPTVRANRERRPEGLPCAIGGDLDATHAAALDDDVAHPGAIPHLRPGSTRPLEEERVEAVAGKTDRPLVRGGEVGQKVTTIRRVDSHGLDDAPQARPDRAPAQGRAGGARRQD